MGHLAAAAGISGLIKTVLSIYYSEIPAHLNFNKPNPHINWANLPINIVTKTCPWTVNNEKIKSAVVSSFGASGTNASVILSEPPQDQTLIPKISPILITLSAKDPERLRIFAAELVANLEQKPDWNINDIAFSLNTGRFPHKHRLSLLVSSLDSLREGLEIFLSSNWEENQKQVIYGEAQSNPKIAFLCNDQGEILPRMGEDLFINEPVFHDAFIKCDRLFQNHLKFSLEDLFYKNQAPDSEHNPLSVQPILFAFHYALCELWKSWGICPSAVLGSGLGEYLAAQQTGIFSLEDAVKLVAGRARFLSQKLDQKELVAFQKIAEEITYHHPQLTLIANGELANNSLTNSAYWGQPIQESKQVAKGITTLHQMGYQIFLEIGTYPNLINIGRQKLAENSILWLSSLVKDCHSNQQMQIVLGETVYPRSKY
ncbi:MAG: acyltransferase domain-containing protein [Planktothrix sp. GU0601_MAG3]|nr:MAG: acyltransferase domain-containing protein [Planktothrix sp. GU0601_MAG3]